MQLIPEQLLNLLTHKKQVEDDIAWIYDFWRSLQPYAYVREEDNVIILPPNLVYKTNTTGIKLLQYVGQGGKLSNLPGLSKEKINDIKKFFFDIRAVYKGEPALLETQQYDFSFTKLPVLGEISVTYRCNNACKFCYAGCDVTKNHSVQKYKELNTDGFKKIIKIFKEQCKIPFFSFTGGEPLMRDDLETLIAYAVSLGLRVNLISNGTLVTPERAKSLFEAGLRTAQISVESTKRSIHDNLSGVAGSFDRTITGIQYLLQAGISVQTNTTLTQMNKEAVYTIPRFIKELGIQRMSMNLYIPAGTKDFREELSLSYTECSQLLLKLQKSTQKAGVELFWYSPIPICIFNPLAHGFGNKNCAACDGLISIAPDGSILPCSSYDEPIGNLLENDFTYLWFSERAQWFKNKLYAPDFCKSCSAFTACQAACPLYWKYNSYEEILVSRRKL